MRQGFGSAVIFVHNACAVKKKFVQSYKMPSKLCKYLDKYTWQ